MSWLTISDFGAHSAFNDAEVAGVGDDAELGLLVDAYHVNARFCCGLEGGKS